MIWNDSLTLNPQVHKQQSSYFNLLNKLLLILNILMKIDLLIIGQHFLYCKLSRLGFTEKNHPTTRISHSYSAAVEPVKYECDSVGLTKNFYKN